MIHDSIENAACYYAAVPGLREVVEAARPIMAKPYQTGRVDLDGDRLFLLCNEYAPEELNAESLMEAHRAYLDIMLMVEGCEYIYVADTAKLSKITRPYDASIEALLAKPEEKSTRVLLNAGEFIVLFPQDAHCPACKTPYADKVRKIIGKAAIQK